MLPALFARLMAFERMFTAFSEQRPALSFQPITEAPGHRCGSGYPIIHGNGFLFSRLFFHAARHFKEIEANILRGGELRSTGADPTEFEISFQGWAQY